MPSYFRLAGSFSWWWRWRLRLFLECLRSEMNRAMMKTSALSWKGKKQNNIELWYKTMSMLEMLWLTVGWGREDGREGVERSGMGECWGVREVGRGGKKGLKQEGWGKGKWDEKWEWKGKGEEQKRYVVRGKGNGREEGLKARGMGERQVRWEVGREGMRSKKRRGREREGKRKETW